MYVRTCTYALHSRSVVPLKLYNEIAFSISRVTIPNVGLSFENKGLPCWDKMKLEQPKKKIRKKEDWCISEIG